MSLPLLDQCLFLIHPEWDGQTGVPGHRWKHCLYAAGNQQHLEIPAASKHAVSRHLPLRSGAVSAGAHSSVGPGYNTQIVRSVSVTQKSGNH